MSHPVLESSCGVRGVDRDLRIVRVHVHRIRFCPVHGTHGTHREQPRHTSLPALAPPTQGHVQCEGRVDIGEDHGPVEHVLRWCTDPDPGVLGERVRDLRAVHEPHPGIRVAQDVGGGEVGLGGVVVPVHLHDRPRLAERDTRPARAAQWDPPGEGESFGVLDRARGTAAGEVGTVVPRPGPRYVGEARPRLPAAVRQVPVLAAVAHEGLVEATAALEKCAVHREQRADHEPEVLGPRVRQIRRAGVAVREPHGILQPTCAGDVLARDPAQHGGHVEAVERRVMASAHRERAVAVIRTGEPGEHRGDEPRLGDHVPVQEHEHITPRSARPEIASRPRAEAPVLLAHHGACERDGRDRGGLCGAVVGDHNLHLFYRVVLLRQCGEQTVQAALVLEVRDDDAHRRRTHSAPRRGVSRSPVIRSHCIAAAAAVPGT